MIAKCAKCQEVFTTESWGRQGCPKCGAELFLNAPPGGANPPPNAAPSVAVQPFVGQPGQVDGPQDQPTPWEQRGTLGFMNAWVDTLKRSMLDPVEFYGRMQVDNADGAVSYFWLNAAIGGFMAEVWQACFALLKGSPQQLTLPSGEPMPGAAILEMMNSPRAHLILAMATIFIAPIGLYISAGIIHVGELLFGGGKKGFQATLKAMAYSSGPNLLQIVPGCGAVVAPLYALVLAVIGLWKTQRTGLGTAIGAVLLPVVVLCCCASVAIGLGVAGAVASSGALK